MKKSILAVLLLVVGAGLSASGASAGRRTVTLWSYSPKNVREWMQRKAEIEAAFNINLNIVQVAEGVFVQNLRSAMTRSAGVHTNIPDIIDWRIEDNQVISSDPAAYL